MQDIDKLIESIKSYNEEDIVKYIQIISKYKKRKPLLLDIFIKHFDNTDEFISSIDFINNRYRVYTLDDYGYTIMNSYKYTDNIQFIKYFLKQQEEIYRRDIYSRKSYTGESLFESLGFIEEDITITVQLLRNISEICDITKDINLDHIQHTLSRFFHTMNKPSVLEDKEKLSLYKEIVGKIIEFKSLYKTHSGVIEVLKNIHRFDDEDKLFASILKNIRYYLEHAEYKRYDRYYGEYYYEDKEKKIELFLSNIYTEIFIDDRYTVHRETFEEFLMTNNYTISIITIIDNLSVERDLLHLQGAKILKHIYSLLENLDNNGYIEPYMIEKKKEDVKILYTYLFKKIKSMSYQEIYIINHVLLMAIPLYKIKEYNYRSEIYLKYNDIIKIFYINSKYLNTDDPFTEFYKLLLYVSNKDYSHYKIEEYTVLKIFTSYNIGSIVQEYLIP